MTGRLGRERAGSELSAGLIERRGNLIKSYSPLTSLLLAGLVTTAVAQDVARDGRTVSGEVPTCRSLSSASRTRGACDEGSTTILRAEKELTLFRPEFTSQIGPQCEVEIDLEYFQRDTTARIYGMIESETCAASNGRYQIEIRVKDENGETRTLDFSESWQRDDDQPVVFTADYPIGENVEVINLRSRRILCMCVDTIEE